MKFIKIILAMLVMALSFSSCLESDLKDLPTFDGNDITAGYAWYRYIGEDKINASGASGYPEAIAEDSTGYRCPSCYLQPDICSSIQLL